MLSFRNGILVTLLCLGRSLLPDIASAQQETADTFPFFKPEPHSLLAKKTPADCRGVIIASDNRNITGVIPKLCSKSKETLSSSLSSFQTKLSSSSPTTPVPRIYSDQHLIFIHTSLDSINEQEIALITSSKNAHSNPGAYILFGNQLLQGQLICLIGECYVSSSEEDLPSGLLVFTKTVENRLQLRGSKAPSERMALFDSPRWGLNGTCKPYQGVVSTSRRGS